MASTSGGGGGPPPPAQLTRRAVRGIHKGKSLLSPALKNPEPKKGRKMSRTVVVDHSRGAPALFGAKAEEIREMLEAAVKQVDVVINGDDERNGCFVVREEGGQVFVRLLDMVAPYNRLRLLDVEALVEGIVRAFLDHRVFYLGDKRVRPQDFFDI